jgi:predicted metal-dependent phosphotriesterase family hydrolase
MNLKDNSRRQFLIKSGVLSGIALAGLPVFSKPESSITVEGKIMTVLGAINSKEAGVCLPHEHITSRFGEEPEEIPTYDYHHASKDIVPYLKYMKELGCDTIMCCTTKYFGRDVKLLKKVSEASGMNIIANTGLYGAANDRYVPKYAFDSTVDKIAKDWIDEFNNGIDSTEIRPGFIKIGIDSGALSEIDAKLVRAGAICHRETGMAIQVHTGDNLNAAKTQLEILKEEGVSPNAWIWIHAQNMKNGNDLLDAAEKGAWISLDALRTVNYYEQRANIKVSVQHHLKLLKLLKEHGYLNQVLLSHDGSSYPQEGKSKRTFEVLFTTFIPMMKVAGFSDQEIDQLIKVNPGNAFCIQKRMI